MNSGKLRLSLALWLGALALPGTLSAKEAPALSQNQLAQGLKEALQHSIQQAVTQLGQADGFLKNPEVKIPFPKSLQNLEKALRTLKQEKTADAFVTSLNRAAEKAVPEVRDVLLQALQQMTLQDAEAILHGPENAATAFFQKTSAATLEQKLLPIVQKATASHKVTASYKEMLKKAGPLAGSLLGKEADLDSYVTQKTLAALFLTMAKEEQQIRRNPQARVTDLLKQIFQL